MDYYDALKSLDSGRKITRMCWDKNWYLEKKDNMIYMNVLDQEDMWVWNASSEDYLADDYVVWRKDEN